ncbi:hypothetical protein AAC03nite_06370 [Alicyclobacillus acidoterrestris]|nr:hypothetical protein AAC03nite_06370 [Alicyclobacillus acidoterrestris]
MPDEHRARIVLARVMAKGAPVRTGSKGTSLLVGPAERAVAMVAPPPAMVEVDQAA